MIPEADLTCRTVSPPRQIVDCAKVCEGWELDMREVSLAYWPLAAGVGAGWLASHGVRLWPWIPFRGAGQMMLDTNLILEQPGVLE